MKDGKIESFTDLNKLADQADMVDKLLQGFIKKTKTFINQKSSILNQKR